MNRVFLSVCLLLVPTTASAHSAIAGLDPFSSGLLHPVLAPNQLMLLLALGLWSGQQRPPEVRWLIGGAVAGLLGGGLIAAADPEATLLPYLPYLVLSSGLALLTALKISATKMLIAAASLLACGLAGHETLLHNNLTGGNMIGMFSAGLAVLLIIFNAHWLASRAARFWMQIGIRIAASWLAALSLMMLGLVILQDVS